MLNWIGWVATATFALSYFFTTPGALRRMQALAALLWISYGILIHALPVIVANVVVAAVAIYSSFRRVGEQRARGNASGSQRNAANADGLCGCEHQRLGTIRGRRKRRESARRL